MNTVIIILLVVPAIAVVLLFAICGFLFNQVIWYKPIKLPAAKGEVGDDFAKDHRKAEEEFGKMPFEKLTLTASNGEKIYARLLLPEKSNGRMTGRTAQGYANSAFPHRTFTAWVIQF